LCFSLLNSFFSFFSLLNLGPVSPQGTVGWPPPRLVMVSQFQHIPIFRSKSFLHKKYVIERLSIKQIAKEIVSSRTAVAKYLKEHGIPLRHDDPEHKYQSRLRYGRIMRSRQLAAHGRELETVKKMKELRSQGFSYWKIADVLNTMKVPTKKQKGRWHARTIQKILKADDSEVLGIDVSGGVGAALGS